MGSFSARKLNIIFGFTAGLFIAGCHGHQQSAAGATDQAQQQAQASSDPASVNLAPAAYSAGTAPANPQSDQTTVAPNAPTSHDGNTNAQPYADSADESDYGIQPDETASEPPPPLPDYDQPPCPGDGYIWTPGYWDYASAGYYWVPGAWVQAPYEGALWTPGYWAYSHSRYAFFHGYWGPHIGFYGGVNYGFGYVGVGYLGGYWNQGHFDYNRSINNINANVVHNVYNYKIVNINNRVSYNGGSDGIRARPRPAEIAAFREPHAPPMRTQVEIRQSASANRAQFAAASHNRPQQFTASRPIAADRNVRPVESHGLRNLPPSMPRPSAEGRQTPPSENHGETNPPHPNQPQLNHPGPNQAAPFRGAPHQPEPNRPAPNHVEPNPEHQSRHTEPNRAQPNPPIPNRPGANHPEPAPREAPPEHHAQPQPASPEQRQPPSHPMPGQLPEQRAPMPEQHAAPNRPAPQQHAEPQHPQSSPEHKQEDHPHP